MLSRAEMEATINSGGSVMHDGHILTSVSQLPSEAALAKGNEAAEKKATAGIDAEIARLQAQRDSLAPPKGKAADLADDPNEVARKRIAAENAAHPIVTAQATAAPKK